MSGDTDRLAEIEALAREEGNQIGRDVLALVEIAKAAREVTLLIFESDEDEVRAAERLRAALSALDGDT